MKIRPRSCNEKIANSGIHPREFSVICNLTLSNELTPPFQLVKLLMMITTLKSLLV